MRHPNKANRLFSLAISYHTQAEQLGNLSDLENAISNFQKRNELIPDGTPGSTIVSLEPWSFPALSLYAARQLCSILKNAMSNERKAVELTHDGHPVYLSNLGISQHACFDLHGDLSILRNAVLNYQKAVELTVDGHLTGRCISRISAVPRRLVTSGSGTCPISRTPFQTMKGS